MSAFKALRDASNNFEGELRKASADLFSAKIGETFEDAIAKRMSDLSLFTSKLRLLRANPIALTPEITEQQRTEDATTQQYSETVLHKTLEVQAVKCLTQANAVQNLITAPNNSIDPEFVEKKEKIIDALTKYKDKEFQLQHLDALLKEREEHLEGVRVQWDTLVGDLREMRDGSGGTTELETSDPLYKKLQTLVDKLELMRWLISKLVTSRCAGYDWLSDPHKRLTALKIARLTSSVESFTQ